MEIRISSRRRILKGKWRILEGVGWNIVPLFKEGFPNRGSSSSSIYVEVCVLRLHASFLFLFSLLLARGNTILKSEWG